MRRLVAFAGAAVCAIALGLVSRLADWSDDTSLAVGIVAALVYSVVALLWVRP